MLNGTPRATCKLVSYTRKRMDAEQIIAEIERLERIFAVPDTGPLSASDLAAANRKHDRMLVHLTWSLLRWLGHAAEDRLDLDPPRLK